MQPFASVIVAVAVGPQRPVTVAVVPPPGDQTIEYGAVPPLGATAAVPVHVPVAVSGVELPFGGVKHSGHGREKGFEALYGFTILKTVVLRHG